MHLCSWAQGLGQNYVSLLRPQSLGQKSRDVCFARKGTGEFSFSHFALPETDEQLTHLGPYGRGGVLFSLCSVSSDITLHDTAPHQHIYPPATYSNTLLPQTGLKRATPDLL